MDSLTLRITRETRNPRKPGIAVYRIYAEVPESRKTGHELAPLIAHLQSLDPRSLTDHNEPEDQPLGPGDVTLGPTERHDYHPN